MTPNQALHTLLAASVQVSADSYEYAMLEESACVLSDLISRAGFREVDFETQGLFEDVE